jgi:hypothetical protein
MDDSMTNRDERTQPGSVAAKPTIPPVLVDHLPPAMKSYGHFVTWRYDEDDEAAGPAKRWRKEQNARAVTAHTTP